MEVAGPFPPHVHPSILYLDFILALALPAVEVLEQVVDGNGAPAAAFFGKDDLAPAAQPDGFQLLPV